MSRQVLIVRSVLLPAFFVLHSGLPAADCNSNGLEDAVETSNGTSPDCNRDGVPDTCQHFGDCNRNNLSDLCDLLEGREQDCDLNGTLDACEIDPATDLNRNGILDVCEQPSTSMF